MALTAALAMVLSGSPSEGNGGQMASASLSQGGPSEGIQIHGHWVIEVLDLDGSLVSHREFENAMTSTGASRAAAILGRTNEIGSWVIALAGPSVGTNLNPCLSSASTNKVCFIGESGETEADSQSLSVTASGDIVFLSGEVTVEKDGQIGRVGTDLGVCPFGTVDCPARLTRSLFGFTTTSLSVSEPVVTGQIVQATVTLTIN